MGKEKTSSDENGITRRAFLERTALTAGGIALLASGAVTFDTPSAEAASTLFEEPIKGSTGWSCIDQKIRRSKSAKAKSLGTLPDGKPFLILGAADGWFKIEYGGKTGYVDHDYCMINLPDVMPSISYVMDYANGNAPDQSVGYKIPGVTGKRLYAKGKVKNKRLGRDEYMCPMLYSVAKKVRAAQKAANKDGYQLEIHDAYRPHSVSETLSKGMSKLYKSNKTVRKWVDKDYKGNPWGKGWFVALSVSKHNTGSALDVSLVKKKNGAEVDMPSKMGECSTKSIKYTPSSSKNYSKYMNKAGKALHEYFTDAGMSPLASEWWHFQDNAAHARIKAKKPNGCDFDVTKVVSK